VPEGPEYDGLQAAELKARLGLPRVDVYDSISSTMDAAHAAAEAGAPAGTLIIADRQTAGRGRAGRRWASSAGAGLYLTLIERPTDPKALDVLSLRLGIRLAPVLDGFADGQRVEIKWPNDLYIGTGKLAGILSEARWQDERPSWVAIGLGINVIAPPEVPGAVGLREGVHRAELLAAVTSPSSGGEAEGGADRVRVGGVRDARHGSGAHVSGAGGGNGGWHLAFRRAARAMRRGRRCLSVWIARYG
jgi:BirA family biotin operon repressor/biotin-[acetyl-CoA-carboxylase] ligase